MQADIKLCWIFGYVFPILDNWVSNLNINCFVLKSKLKIFPLVLFTFFALPYELRKSFNFSEKQMSMNTIELQKEFRF